MNDSGLAPICLFTYNRLAETQQTVEALQKNFLAKQSELFVFSDGPKNMEGKEKVDAVLNYLQTINGFKKVQIKESLLNKGLANSIIDGVTEIIQQYGKVIVLEDDLVTSPNFLDFMNQSLDYFKDDKKIFSTSGWTLDLNVLNVCTRDYYLHYRSSSWGWGIWKDRWDEIDWDRSNFIKILGNTKKQNAFKRGGGDMPNMLKNYLFGKNDSWAIRACYHQFEKDLLSVAPSKSKVNNIGFGVNATHTKNRNRFDAILDNSLQRKFTFEKELFLDKIILKEFKSKFSIIARIKSKLFL